MSPGRIGILALQGDIAEHAAILVELGARPVEVTGPADLDGLDGLVLPGGESTTMSLLLHSAGLAEPLGAVVASGTPVLGTCAGMILLASDVIDGRPGQLRLGALDLVVRRNGFGRQVASFECSVEVDGIDGGPVDAVFIRAPRVESVGKGVSVLASIADPLPGRDNGSDRRIPVVCSQGAVVACAFHPELSGETRLHRMLLER